VWEVRATLRQTATRRCKEPLSGCFHPWMLSCSAEFSHTLTMVCSCEERFTTGDRKEKGGILVVFTCGSCLWRGTNVQKCIKLNQCIFWYSRKIFHLQLSLRKWNIRHKILAQKSGFTNLGLPGTSGHLLVWWNRVAQRKVLLLGCRCQ